jgi:protein O-GlcNAc transferase
MELTIDQALQQGVAAHKEGKLQEAERLYRAILQSQPLYPDANHNLGVLAVSVNKADVALPLFKAAIEANPKIEQFWLSYIDALIKEQQFDNAKEVLEQAKKHGVAVDKVDALASKFTSTTQLNEPKLAVQKKSLTLSETRKKLSENKKKKAKTNPLNDMRPSESQINNLLQHYENGRYGDAEKLTLSITQEFPKHQFGWKILGCVLIQTGRIREALVPIQKAAALSPQDAEAHSNLGIMLIKLGRLEEAEASYRQAIALKSDYAEAHSNLGVALQQLGRLDESDASLRQAIAFKPDLANAHYNLGNTLQEFGRLEQALASYNQAIELKTDYFNAYSNKNLCLNYLSSCSPLFIFEQHLECENQFGKLKAEPPLSPRSNQQAEKRLRVGYVSGDFRTHSVAYFFEPLLQGHNSNVVETFCYYNNLPVDEMTKRLMATSDHWRSIVGVIDLDVINLIRSDKIDILVDLSGHTAKNRLLVFVQKPAPIQVTWLGYPNTTGLSSIDYRFTDMIADPIGEADEVHSESLVRLANGFQCYKGNKAVHSNSELPFKRQGYITFGSFNNLTKVTPEVIKVWSHILHALPKSCLVLKAKQLKYNASHYLDCFKQEGITEDRITLHGYMSSKHDHLELYNAIDICLDPFPYNGATTTCEALWMGVPVITLLGDRHAGRVGASILTNVGLTDFIAEDIDGYIKLAVEMAANTNYLKEVRKGLRERMQRAPLCDASSFASDVEAAYQEMWRCYQK